MVSVISRRAHKDSRLSGVAVKQLSAIMAPGTRRVEAQDVSTLFSFIFTMWCVLIFVPLG